MVPGDGPGWPCGVGVGVGVGVGTGVGVGAAATGPTGAEVAGVLVPPALAAVSETLISAPRSVAASV